MSAGQICLRLTYQVHIIGLSADFHMVGGGDAGSIIKSQKAVK